IAGCYAAKSCTVRPSQRPLSARCCPAVRQQRLSPRATPMLELESAATPSGEPPSLSERVLVVEDDRATRLGLTELVRSWGYVAESAADGEEALQRITTFRPGIIVSDVVMPRMDG